MSRKITASMTSDWPWFASLALVLIAAVWCIGYFIINQAGTVDLGISPVSVQSGSASGKTFCKLPAGYNLDSASSRRGWSFPLYACGIGGIDGPKSMIRVAKNTDGRMILSTNGGGANVVYTVMMANTDGFGDTKASGAEFRDGYSFSPSFVIKAGLTQANLLAQCQSGFSPANATMDDLDPYGAGQASYAPGVPSMTPDGGFICGSTHIVSGSLDMPD